jgi:protein-L-isoaspartate(D-aspartate) O-methyltransferase
MSKDSLINNLIEQGYLKTLRIIEAFRKIDRADFVPGKFKSLAYEDVPLPIGEGQTISQPLTVAFMLELLRPEAGDKILDVGYGSGWTSSLLAEVVGDTGYVYAIERIPELCEFGRGNIEKYGFLSSGRVECLCGDGTKGWSEKAPFDKILAGASAKELPQAWKEQLKIGGRIVAPIEWSIWLFVKKSETEFEEIEHPGFSFVPLISLP